MSHGQKKKKTINKKTMNRGHPTPRWGQPLLACRKNKRRGDGDLPCNGLIGEPIIE